MHVLGLPSKFAKHADLQAVTVVDQYSHMGPRSTGQSATRQLTLLVMLIGRS